MQITKHEHACFVVTNNDESLIVDPGAFTLPLPKVQNVVAIVITHEHGDHWTPEHLTRILEWNPDARILGPAGVAAAASDFPVETVADGDVVSLGAFTVAFYGSAHAVIHESIPVVDNVGVLINDRVWYGGDSYTVPPVPVETMAVPIGAPWLKIGEVMDYVAAVRPKAAFPTHDAVLSVVGKDMANARVEAVTTAGGGTFHAIGPDEFIDV